MKIFTYHARDNQGAIKKGVLSASDRCAALVELKAAGLAPVSLKEGGKFGKPGKGIRQFVIGKRVLAFALAATLILVVGFVWNNIKSAAKDLGVNKQKTRETVKIFENTKEQQIFHNTNTISVVHPAVVGVQFPNTNEIVQINDAPFRVSTNSIEYIMAQKDGRIDEKGDVTPPRPVFRTGTDQIIGMIASAKLGDPPPPLPNIHKMEDISKILAADIVLYDDDSEEVASLKRNVAMTKQVIKEYLAQGGTIETFLSYYHNELQKAYTERQGVQKYVMELYQAGDLKGAREYAEEQNKKFNERGIRPIKLPVALGAKSQ